MKIINGWAVPSWDEFMAKEMKPDGSYQRGHLDAAMKYVKGYMVAVDGGAHIGTWTKIMSRYFDNVLSFEPAADTFECLKWNKENQRWPNITLYQQALGSQPGRCKMTLEGFDRAILLKNTGARFVRPGNEVDVITLDSLNLKHLDFLKLDVEGSEVSALMGAMDTLNRLRPVVLFEDKGLWKRYGHERQAPHKILRKLGFKKLERVKMDEIWSG